ncbi:MAG: ribbon-helix-helix protein, CopG family [Deltaproteobacteria bacterium]|nr:ribbon-helix-helix protein, CopG family [Deltaproteobacteria bacterium]
MVRTQIQLEEEQAARIRRAAADRHVSVAELIRRSVDLYLSSMPRIVSREDQKERAIRAAGRFRSGVTDLGEAHDQYLEEAFGR